MLVDELGHSVGDEAGESDGEIQQAASQRLVLDCAARQAAADGGDVPVNGVVDEEALVSILGLCLRSLQEPWIHTTTPIGKEIAQDLHLSKATIKTRYFPSSPSCRWTTAPRR
jgi:hypothetical protein